MMQDESAEIQVQSTFAKKVMVAADASIYSEHSEEGPDDEFRPVKISIVSTTQEDRDEWNAFEINTDKDASIGGDDDRETEEENEREEAEVTEMRDETLGEDIEVTYSTSRVNDEELEVDDFSVVSALGKSQDQENDSSSEQLELEGEAIIEMDIIPQNTGVSIFDTSLLDEESKDSTLDGDELSVVSKSVVDESSKNVKEAEALAKEMKRQLAESLAEFSISPKPTIDNGLDEAQKNEPKNVLGEKEDALQTSASTEPPFYSENKILKLVKSGDSKIELKLVGSAQDTASVSSSSSSKDKVPLRRFRHRRPSTSSWANATEEVADSASPRAVQFLSTLPVTHQQQKFLEIVVIPAVFLVVSVAICRTFFHPWLKVGNGQSNTWALTWTVLCIVAVVAPVCALEYMLLGGLLAGTVVQETLAKYPEMKRFLKDVRRMRLKTGWWYPSEVRALRKDLETMSAERLLNQEEKLMSQRLDIEEDADARSIQRQMSREEHRREKSQLEKVFDSERKEWYAVKEQLIAEASSKKEISVKLRDQLETEQQKQKQLAAQKEQLENNMEVERAQWKFTRISLEEALKTAVATQEDSEKMKEFFAKMECARDEERHLWEKERQGFQATIQQFEKDARAMQQEHEGKLRLFDEMAAVKQSQWEDERKSLKEAVENAISEAKSVKDTLESQICQLMDANDSKIESEIRTLKLRHIKEKKDLEEMLEEAKEEQNVSLQCVSNLQSLLEEERTEWESSRKMLEEDVKSEKAEHESTEQKLKQTGTVLEEERRTWEAARKTFEEALVVATAATLKDSDRKVNVEQQDTCVTTVLRQELKSKESKIKALEVSIQQLENITSMQDSLEITSSKNWEKANREAESSPVAFVGTYSTENSSNIELDDASEASTYHSWIQKVQDTYGEEQQQLLKGLFTQHIRWQAANHHVKQLLDSSKALLEASESLESSEAFQECLVKHTATSESAKQYMDDLAAMKTPEPPRSLMAAVAEGAAKGAKDSEPTEENISRSIIRLRNPWSKNALMWEQIWAKTGSPKTVAKTICSGIVVGTGVGLGLFHLRSMKQQKLYR